MRAAHRFHLEKGVSMIAQVRGWEGSQKLELARDRSGKIIEEHTAGVLRVRVEPKIEQAKAPACRIGDCPALPRPVLGVFSVIEAAHLADDNWSAVLLRHEAKVLLPYMGDAIREGRRVEAAHVRVETRPV